jgi:hypothetical protein
MAVQLLDVSGPEQVIERVDSRCRDAHEDFERTGRRNGPIEELVDVGATEGAIPQGCAHQEFLSHRPRPAFGGDVAKLVLDINVRFKLM